MRTWQQLKNVYHYVQAFVWRAWYGFPDTKLKIVGVTGTNGKTTTCYILHGIFSEVYGKQAVGMLTTVAFRIGTKEIINETKMTTLPSRLVFSYMQQMVRAGVSHLVLEMTSHALDQGRLSGVRLVGAIILNVEREHLDYHGTMEEYARSKQRIVDYLIPEAVLVAKRDDGYVANMIDYATRRGVTVREFTEEMAHNVRTSLPGAVNQQNALAASLMAESLGINLDVVQRGLARTTHVPGRMEQWKTPQGVTIVIDYAVTPEALERLYGEIREKASGKVYGILGAAGLRDRGKRASMAATVKKYADELIITREDPWTESEEQIFSDLEAGLDKQGTSWLRIVDRREALTYLLKKAQSGDTVVATGKGAETGMAIGKNIVPWKEREVIEEIAEKLRRAS